MTTVSLLKGRESSIATFLSVTFLSSNGLVPPPDHDLLPRNSVIPPLNGPLRYGKQQESWWILLYIKSDRESMGW
jgi:hypothetical protein